MKILKLLLFACLIAPIFMSCSKDEKDDDTEPAPEPTVLTSNCKIDKIIRTEEGEVNTITYHYDGDNITKITERNDGGSEDHSSTEATYNSDGTYQKIEEFSDWGEGYQLRRLYTYTYNADGEISVVNESRYDYSEPYNSVTTITYANGNPISVTSTGSDNMKVTDIVFENGNMKTAKMDFNGDGAVIVDILVTSDDKYNNAKHDIPTENILDIYNTNNMLSVECVNDFTLQGESGDTLILAGSKLVSRTLTYNTEGEILKMISHPTMFDDDGEDRVKDYTYICD